METLPKTDSVKNGTVVLSTAFLPPIEWFRAAALSSYTLLEGFETYQKQSYRTRCRILTSTGVETLKVPVVHSSSRLIQDIPIDYSEAWVQRMERALKTAYMSSPFYIYYADDIIPVLRSGMNSLFELNLALINVLAELLGLRLDIRITQEYVSEYGEGTLDLRNSIHP
ncbi:MAG: WbqC family protein [Alistipes sp.]|nr:WbqC family protein [Candidatus Minthomonas equi]